MIKPNKLNSPEWGSEKKETEWDDLREIPFAGERDSVFQLKQEIRTKIIQILEQHQDTPLTAKEFMLVVIETLQPILASRNMIELLNDYAYWNDVLGELKPIIAGFWAECDPMMLQHLFVIFVAQFMVMLQFWAKVDFADIGMHDCATLGEFCIDVGAVQSDMLTNIATHWNILGDGRLKYQPL